MKQTLIIEIQDSERDAFLKLCSDYAYSPPEMAHNRFEFVSLPCAEFMDELERGL